MKIKENEKINKYLDLSREQKTTVEQEDKNDTNCSLCFWHVPQRFGEELEE